MEFQSTCGLCGKFKQKCYRVKIERANLTICHACVGKIIESTPVVQEYIRDNGYVDNPDF